MMDVLGYYTSEDITNRKCTLDDILRLSPMLNENDYMLYVIYLNVRPDLPEDERLYYTELIHNLKEKENMNMHSMLKIFSNDKS